MRQNQDYGRDVRGYRESRDEADMYNRRGYGQDRDDMDDESRVARYDTRGAHENSPYERSSRSDRERGSQERERHEHETVYPYTGPRYSDSSRRYEPAGDGNGGSGWPVEGGRYGPDRYTRPRSERGNEFWGARAGWADESYPGERSRYERSGSRGWSSSDERGGTYGVGGLQGGSWGTRGESGWNRPMWTNRHGVGAQFGETNNYRGRGPKGYTRSDERICEDINDRLTDDSSIDASEIECNVQNGEAVLTGSVRDRETKRMVEDVVESVSGVKNVQNNLRIKKDAATGESSESTSSTGSRASSTSSTTTGFGSKSTR